MKYFKTVLYTTAFTAATLFFGAGGAQNVSAQTIVRAPATSSETQETKGAVDLLLDDLEKRNEPVLRRCVENCPKSQVPDSGGQAIDKVIPEYPPIARAARASGNVVVLVLIDEEGKVIAAQSVSGHPLLQAASVNAARQSTFTPTEVDGKPVKVLATLTYTFVIQ
ncbi:MAG TPA: energy transducer TonB [Pyrinomonadaceae bacterium]|nr:energy transducer TonB [Pyrinomonadaceae bacterium]